MGLYGMLVVTDARRLRARRTRQPGLLPASPTTRKSRCCSAKSTRSRTTRSRLRSTRPGSARPRCGPASRAAAAIRPPAQLTITCYPPAVNYTPLYYLINGVAFNKTNAAASLFADRRRRRRSDADTVLVRLVNAGLRMHVPSIVGSQTDDCRDASRSRSRQTGRFA